MPWRKKQKTGQVQTWVQGSTDTRIPLQHKCWLSLPNTSRKLVGATSSKGFSSCRVYVAAQGITSIRNAGKSLDDRGTATQIPARQLTAAALPNHCQESATTLSALLSTRPLTGGSHPSPRTKPPGPFRPEFPATLRTQSGLVLEQNCWNSSNSRIDDDVLIVLSCESCRHPPADVAPRSPLRCRHSRFFIGRRLSRPAPPSRAPARRKLRRGRPARSSAKRSTERQRAHYYDGGVT